MNKSVCRVEHTHAHTPVIPRSVFALHYTVKLFRNVNSPQWRAGYDTEPFETLFFCALRSFFARQLWHGTPSPYGNTLHISDRRLVGGQKSDQNQVLWTLRAHFSHQYLWKSILAVLHPCAVRMYISELVFFTCDIKKNHKGWHLILQKMRAHT